MRHRQMVVGSAAAGARMVSVERDSPAPGQGQIGVRVLRTGVSFGNMMVADMAYRRPNPRKPTVLGYEIVGTVEDAGPGVTGFRKGDRVAVYTGGSGGYTEYANWKAADCVKIPEGASDDGAVCVALNYMTAQQAMFRVGRVTKGQTVFATGASGGVGTALIELARNAGVRVIGAASAHKHAALAARGAEPVDYTKGDLVQAVRALCPEGVDVAIDGVGGGMELRAMDTVRKGGVAVSYGMRSANASGSFRLGPIVWNLLRFLGRGLLPGQPRAKTYFIELYKRSHPDHHHEDFAALLQLLAEGKIAPLVEDVIPLSEADRAHQLLLSGKVTGKLVLDCTR